MRFPKTSLKAKALMDKTRQIRDQFPKNRLSNKRVISLIPNTATLIGLCVGLSSIRFALEGQLMFAVISILIAALFDMFDGGLARMLNSATPMGAELDSLSDAITFGVAPSLVLYVSVLNKVQPYGWMVVLLYICCMALRLARFNVMVSGEQPAWMSRFFIGVPAPMGAYLSLAPVMFFIYSGQHIFSENVYVLYLLSVSFLVVSRIPTFSVKKITVDRTKAIPIMFFNIVMIGFFLTEPWLFLSVFSVVYMVSIIFSVMRYRRYEKEDLNKSFS